MSLCDDLTKDEGIYEYIDEQSVGVRRSSRLNNPDVALSGFQNDMIQQTAVKEVMASKFASESEKACAVSAPRVGFAGSGFGADLAGQEPGAVGAGVCEEREEDEDEEMEEQERLLNPQPFGALFERLSRPEKKRTAPSSAKEPATTATTSSANKKQRRNQDAATASNGANKRRNLGVQGGDGADKSNRGERGGVGAGTEDETILTSYITQFKELQSLDAPRSDDQSFAAWYKNRAQKLNELKSGIQAKKKSVGRRSGDASEIQGAFQEVIESINEWAAFLKRLHQGNAEGRHLYDELVTIVDANDQLVVSNAAWERCIRGLAFEDDLLNLTDLT